MSAPSVSLRGLRIAVIAAEVGTVFLAGGAFVLSFTALRDLAGRSGVDAELAWLWPLIVDGLIVVATVAVFALAGTREVWYPWMLLILGTGVSVTANAIHAVMAAEPGVLPLLAASVASVPPLVLVFSTHLTAILIRHSRTAYAIANPNPNGGVTVDSSAASTLSQHTATEVPPIEPASSGRSNGGASTARSLPQEIEPDSRRELATQLRGEGLNNSQIARLLGVNRSTVGRWDLSEPSEQEYAS